MTKPVLAGIIFTETGLIGYTPDCGCCSDTYSTEYEYENFPWTDDDLIAFVEKEERRVAALRDDLNDYLRKDN